MKSLMFFVAMLLLCSVFAYSQTSSINQTDNKGLKQGFWEEKVPNGTMKGKYLNDKKEGNWITYGGNGNFLKLESYSGGLKQGIVVEVDQRGYLVGEMYYTDDLLDGTAKKFYYGTNPASVIDYKKGKINGKKKVYYENAAGKLTEESDYTEDVKDGESKFYSSNGDPIAEYVYRKGALEGIQKSYYPGKKLMSEQNYVKNVESGLYKEYFENGKLKIEGNYKEGKMEGKWVEYFENGVVKSDGSYVNGEKEGKWIEYDEAGKVMSEARYAKGVKK